MLFLIVFRMIVIAITAASVTSERHSLEVEIENGWVRGDQITPSLFSWRGIPYAKPPLGKLRFEPPQKPDNWTGTWDASYDRSQCMQTVSDDIASVIFPRGDEDCLYINVYTPKVPETNQTLPIMMWIYGGAFIQGNSSYKKFGPNKLVSQNMIYVSFNYRLGIFGFISTGDNAAPGNTGLRDQILAIKWVKHNIAAFGGNPHNITIFGQSAGAVSVNNLLLSPLTRGLFHRVIMNSASALCMWGSTTHSKEAAFRTGARLGIVTSDSYDLIKRLKHVAADRLQRMAITIMLSIFAAKQLDAVFVYTPVIEHQHKGAVITGSYFNRLSSGNFPKIPVMIGYNSNEVLYFKLIMDLLTPFMVMYDFIPALLVPSSLRANKSDLVEIGTEIKNHYVGPFGSFAPSHFKQLRKFMNDNEFIRPIQQTARFLARYTRTYLYVFSYHHSGEDGAGHEAELSYLFNSEDNSYSDKYIKKCMTKLWTNFGIYGNPTPHNIEQCGNVVWKPIVPGDKLDYLRINLNVSMSTNPSKKDMKFWYKLFEKYANMPLNTY